MEACRCASRRECVVLHANAHGCARAAHIRSQLIERQLECGCRDGFHRVDVAALCQARDFHATRHTAGARPAARSAACRGCAEMASARAPPSNRMPCAARADGNQRPALSIGSGGCLPTGQTLTEWSSGVIAIRSNLLFIHAHAADLDLRCRHRRRFTGCCLQ